MRPSSRALIVAVAGTVSALAYGFDLVGTPLRVVHVLTLVAVSMAAGVGIASFRDTRRNERSDPPSV